MANNNEPSTDNPCDVKAVNYAWKNANCQRLTWDYTLYTVDKELKIDKRISIWVRNDGEDGPVWKRLCVITRELNWMAYCLDGDNGQIRPLTLSKVDQDKLKVVDNSIVFNGGFLEVNDPGLLQPLKDFELDLASTSESTVLADCKNISYVTEKITERDKELFPWKLSECVEPLLAQKRDRLVELAQRTDSNLSEEDINQLLYDCLNKLDENVNHQLMPAGRNIHIEVDFREEKVEEKQPLFFFPQNDSDDQSSLGVIFLGTSEKREIFWTISNQFLHSDRFELERGNSTHLISVSQDYNWLDAQLRGEDEEPYFEMMVDSIGLGYATKLSGDPETAAVIAEKTIEECARRITNAEAFTDPEADHDFGTGPRTFWIGYVPTDQQFAAANFPADAQWQSWKGTVFEGSIKRLYFDPNSSCSAC